MRKINSDYITELEKEFSNYSFMRIEKNDGMYITNDINRNLENDSRIFKETQVKRILRGSCAPFLSSILKNKLSYFSQKENEDPSKIYKFDNVKNLESEDYVIHNIGHATQLIQIPGFNILTDPVFNNLNWLLYPAKTDSYPGIEELPKIDCIIISHNHRDHVDRVSLQKLTEKQEQKGWPQPQIFVPKEDKEVLKNFGLKDVEEMEWYTKISVNKNVNGIQKIVNFISIPADHRSGRYGYDHHKSLVTGWIINSEEENVIFKFSGDTRRLSNENQQAVDAVLWYEIKNKAKNRGKGNEDIEIPDIICLEPSGPNYTRCYMDVTHQSTSYSALLKFVEAENLAKLSGANSEDILKKIKTVIMHHKKFELGPDRFNEGLFIFKKLLQYLYLNEDDLSKELMKQKEKLTQHLDKEKLRKMLPFGLKHILATLPEHTSLLVHAKDFIITEIIQMTNKDTDKENIIQYLINNTIFAKIGERLNDKQIVHSQVKVENIHKYFGKGE